MVKFESCRRLVALAITFCFLSLQCVVAEGPVKSRHIRVPGDDVVVSTTGLLSHYFSDDGRHIVGLSYSGTPTHIEKRDERFAGWNKLPKLKRIAIEETTVTEGLMSHVAEVKTTETLEINRCIFGAKAMLPLKDMPLLKTLKVEFSEDFPIDNWTFLGELSSLRTLDISSIRVGSDVVGELLFLKNLSELRITIDDSVPDQLLADVARSLSVNDLEISIDSPHRFFNALTSKSRLRNVRIYADNIGKDEFIRFTSSTSIRSLELEGLSRGATHTMPENNQLQSLHISFEPGVAVSAVDLAFLPGLKRLEQFICHHRMETFPTKSLESHDHLESLFISETELQISDIQYLKSMPRLRRLSTKNKESSEWHRTAKRELPDVEIVGP